MDTFAYLFAAYAAFWTLLFAYLLHLHRRENDLRRQLESLAQRLAGNGGETG